MIHDVVQADPNALLLDQLSAIVIDEADYLILSVPVLPDKFLMFPKVAPPSSKSKVDSSSTPDASSSTPKDDTTTASSGASPTDTTKFLRHLLSPLARSLH